MFCASCGKGADKLCRHKHGPLLCKRCYFREWMEERVKEHKKITDFVCLSCSTTRSSLWHKKGEGHVCKSCYKRGSIKKILRKCVSCSHEKYSGAWYKGIGGGYDCNACYTKRGGIGNTRIHVFFSCLREKGSRFHKRGESYICHSCYERDRRKSKSKPNKGDLAYILN